MGTRYNEMNQTRVNHSARIHALEKAVRDVKIQNDVLKEELVKRGDQEEDSSRNGYQYMDYQKRQVSDQYPTAPPEQGQGYYSPRRDQGQAQGYDQGYRSYDDGYKNGAGYPQSEEPRQGRRVYENEQHRMRHGEDDGYRGMNKMYHPETVTSYRREQATIKYARTGHLGQDLNKFFHDSKQMYMTERPPTTSDVYPQTNVAGVMYLIRYEDSGFADVRTALREQQTVMHSHQGSIIGIARPSHICVLEGLEDWTPARRNTPKPNVSVPHRCVDEDIAMLWFPSFERANDFANNSHKNRFRQMDFPTPMAANIVTLQMNTPLYQRELDTFLFMELVGVRRYSADNLKHFEEEVRERMLGFSKNCIPLVVAHYMEGKESLRQGSRGQLFRHQSKVYVSRFSSLEDIADLWKANVIQNCRDAWGIHGPVNTFAICLRDFRD